MTDSGYTSVLQGSVLTEDGAPIGFATITVGTQSTTADGAGNFKMDLMSGTYPITIAAPGHMTAIGTLVIAGGLSTFRTAIAPDQRTSTLFGRVLEACTGRPIAGARVGSPSANVLTNADGTYALHCCFNSVTDFTVTKSGYKTIAPQLMRTGGATARDWLMEPGF